MRFLLLTKWWMKRKFKTELLMFKLYFEKSYDLIDWNYLDVVMGKMNCRAFWSKWIMEFVSTEATSLLVNGSQTGEFNLKGGLCQDDPLSQFLFLIVSEGLNIMLNATVEADMFSGYKICEGNAVCISHV